MAILTSTTSGTTRSTLRRVTVIGCGLIGTSVALALRAEGIRIRLADHDPRALAEAVRLGAGAPLTVDEPPADVVVIATPPSAVPQVLRDAQARELGAVYTDVASTKARILATAELAGCDLSRYVPGHPMAGREAPGAAAARAGLFTGRKWALCPCPATALYAVRAVADLVAACGAQVTLLSPPAHDRAAAAVSHAPLVLSAALAARFAYAAGQPELLSLAGRGLYDVTRVAGSPPELWIDILEHNADAVAGVLEEVVDDLTAVAQALRAPEGSTSWGVVADLLVRGNLGRELIVDACAPAARDRGPVAAEPAEPAEAAGLEAA
ncbi:prephenate dehydrogenase [Nonomuraea ceibae]|uniref:prephenate dehydrogenase n=1 Tax=Nonomuraea ceibae TaxID=1935170 RepID=UPI001C5F7E58|nr:prephenate dehydrogenase [Nonomuraea ceibae]